jgi:hypothetical protein
LKTKVEEILPQALSDLIKEVLSKERPVDLASFAYKDTLVVLKRVPFERELGTEGTILVTFKR